MSIPPGAFRNPSELERKVNRLRLETDVQNLLGPIRNIDELTDAMLYGMRDRARGKPHMRDRLGRPIWLYAGKP